jgi:hypothetical protein
LERELPRRSKCPYIWGIGLALLLVLGGYYLYAFYRRRALQKARYTWDTSFSARSVQEANPLEEELRKSAERQRREGEDLAVLTPAPESRHTEEQVERKRRFIEQRQKEERQKAEAAIEANRKRLELEEQRKQDETRAVEQTHPEVNSTGQEEQARRIPAPVGQPERPSTERRDDKEISKADDIAGIAAGVVRMCHGKLAIPVDEMQQMIARKLVAARGRSPTPQEIEAIETTVMELASANRSDGWIYLPVKQRVTKGGGGLAEEDDEEDETESARGWQENAIRAMEGD